MYRTEFDFFREGGKPSEEELTAQYARVLRTSGRRLSRFGLSTSATIGTPAMAWDPSLCQPRPPFQPGESGCIQAPAPRPLPCFPKRPHADSSAVCFNDRRSRRRSGDHCRSQARPGRHKIPFDGKVPVGVMIETPAAAHTCDLMASRVDFFCLGTNDLDPVLPGD